VLGKEPWPRQKILREACAERDRRQSLCRRFDSLCREFPALGKAWISSSDWTVFDITIQIVTTSSRWFLIDSKRTYFTK
jgi:hypothetical protein